MENNKAEVKSRNGVIVFLIILVLIFASAFASTSVYILGYKKGVKAGDEDKNKEANTAVVQEDTNKKEENNTTTETKTVSADERFEMYSKGVQNNLAKLEKESLDISGDSDKKEIFVPSIRGDIVDSEELNITNIYINYKKEAYIQKKSGEEIKILDNAIDCGIYPSGNGGVLFVIWVIDVNGNVYTQNYNTMEDSNKTSFNLTKVEGLKNIVSAAVRTDLSAVGPVFFDIDGNMYK
ncbi:MAG: hypothetical protein K6B70_03125 [Clostridia bacterium]|nr:hypothetical protein [Clostridia bacterium]